MEAFCTVAPVAHSGAASPARERLWNLARIGLRSAERLRAAASVAGDWMLSRRLEEFADMRDAHARELTAIASLSMDEDAETSAQADDVARAVAEELPQRIELLTDLERGESAASRAYAQAISRAIAGDELHETLTQHLGQTLRMQRILRDWRDLMIED